MDTSRRVEADRIYCICCNRVSSQGRSFVAVLAKGDAQGQQMKIEIPRCAHCTLEHEEINRRYETTILIFAAIVFAIIFTLAFGRRDSMSDLFFTIGFPLGWAGIAYFFVGPIVMSKFHDKAALFFREYARDPTHQQRSSRVFTLKLARLLYPHADLSRLDFPYGHFDSHPEVERAFSNGYVYLGRED